MTEQGYTHYTALRAVFVLIAGRLAPSRSCATGRSLRSAPGI